MSYARNDCARDDVDRLARAAALALDERAEDALQRQVRGAHRAARRAHERRGRAAAFRHANEVRGRRCTAITIDSQPFERRERRVVAERADAGVHQAGVRRAGGRRRRARGEPPRRWPNRRRTRRCARSARGRASRSWSSVRSTSRLRWPRAQNFHAGCVRSREPPGGSSSHTSAPASASTCPTIGGGQGVGASVTTRRPASGSSVPWPPRVMRAFFQSTARSAPGGYGPAGPVQQYVTEPVTPQKKKSRIGEDGRRAQAAPTSPAAQRQGPPRRGRALDSSRTRRWSRTCPATYGGCASSASTRKRQERQQGREDGEG